MEQPRRFGANVAVCPGRGDGRVRPRSGGFSCALCPAPGVQCEQWPAAGPEHRILANPMREFVGRAQDTDHVHHRLFHHYKERFGKSYGSEEEQEHRKRAFVHNMRYGAKALAVGGTGLCLLGPSCARPQVAPGAVTPVKDQAVCGSCWSFATTGAMEGALFLKTGVLTPLSQQVLIDCSWGFGNQACDGGEEWRAYEWIKKHGGIASTESYGPYLGQNGYCHYNQSEPAAQLASYVNVEPGSAAALKAALVKHGPVAVNIDASHKSFAFYANGVYEEPRCGNETAQLDHAVLAVGYGVLHGKSYWLVKNSWSTYWGNDGYILMAMKDNNCGVATEASFPILA
uniref:Peptidase C1A papain C-terminal domain-containing protein n=1 Tax=Apteryx owenii TaxID=8824 RepID=A0A8B9QIC4_APTOW